MFNYIIAVDVLCMVEWQPCTWKVGSLHASLIIKCSANMGFFANKWLKYGRYDQKTNQSISQSWVCVQCS